MQLDYNLNLLQALEIARADLRVMEARFDADTMDKIGLKPGDLVRKGHLIYRVRRASVSGGFRAGDPPSLFIVANRIYKDGTKAWSPSYLDGAQVERVLDTAGVPS